MTIDRLTAQRDALSNEWEILHKKVTELRTALVIEAGAAVKFQLKQQILEEEGNLSEL
jgi:hypothetical protein